MRISDWSSDVCSSDLRIRDELADRVRHRLRRHAVEHDAVAPVPDPVSAEAGLDHAAARGEIGRASCRESVCQYVYISVVAVYLNKKINNYDSNIGKMFFITSIVIKMRKINHII